MSQLYPSIIGSCCELRHKPDFGTEGYSDAAIIAGLLKHDLLEPEGERIKLQKLHELRQTDANEITREGIKELETELLNCNWRFIFSRAKKYSRITENHGLKPLELIAAGARGFLRALRQYQITSGNRLLTYATKFIGGEIINEIHRATGLSRSAIKDRHTWNNAMNKFKNTIAINGDIEKFAETLDIDPEHLLRFEADLKLSKTRPTSIHESTEQSSGGASLENILAALNNVPTLNQDDIAAIWNRIELTPREKEIIVLRYGLSPDSYGNALSQTEVAEAIAKKDNTKALTRERIRQVEESALEKLAAFLGVHQETYHWIPYEANIEALNSLMEKLFRTKQNLFNDLREFKIALLTRLREERVLYRDNDVAVLTEPEYQIMIARLGLWKSGTGDHSHETGYEDVARLTGRTGKNYLSDITQAETKAIRKIYGFFKSKSGKQLQEFFSGALGTKALTKYSFKKIRKKLREYISAA